MPPSSRLRRERANKPGEKMVYSDTGPILLGEIVRRVSGKPLDHFLRRELSGRSA